jgi:hypothetical protein
MSRRWGHSTATKRRCSFLPDISTEAMVHSTAIQAYLGSHLFHISYLLSLHGDHLPSVDDTLHFNHSSWSVTFKLLWYPKPLLSHHSSVQAHPDRLSSIAWRQLACLRMISKGLVLVWILLPVSIRFPRKKHRGPLLRYLMNSTFESCLTARKSLLFCFWDVHLSIFDAKCLIGPKFKDAEVRSDVKFPRRKALCQSWILWRAERICKCSLSCEFLQISWCHALVFRRDFVNGFVESEGLLKLTLALLSTMLW